ncbi:MAG: hypothetical protein OXC40_07850 [Proteobacteria bacterium]|nr:hypothetical protein [Pseudomonadota bacterium]
MIFCLKRAKFFPPPPPPHGKIVNANTDANIVFPYVASLRVINTKCDDASAYYRHDLHNGNRGPIKIGASKEWFPGYGDSFFHHTNFQHVEANIEIWRVLPEKRENFDLIRPQESEALPGDLTCKLSYPESGAKARIQCWQEADNGICNISIPFTSPSDKPLILEQTSDQSVTKKPTVIEKDKDDVKALAQAVISAARDAAASAPDTEARNRAIQAAREAAAKYGSSMADIRAPCIGIYDKPPSLTDSVADKTAIALEKMICDVIETRFAVIAAIEAVRRQIIENTTTNVALDSIQGISTFYQGSYQNSCEGGGVKSERSQKYCKRRESITDALKKVSAPESYPNNKYCLLTVPDSSEGYDKIFNPSSETPPFQGYDLCASHKNAGIKKFVANLRAKAASIKPDEHNNLIYGTIAAFNAAHTTFCQ